MLDTFTSNNPPGTSRNNPRRDENTRRGFFALIEKKFGLEHYFENGFPVKNASRLTFLLVLGVLYIGNAHHAEKVTRKISGLQIEVEELRADYITLKADLMFATKQSEVARRVRSLGLHESVTPPDKIKPPDEKH